MNLLINGKEMNIIQVTDINSGFAAGLYLVEKDKIDHFEEEICMFDDQNLFDENNRCGAKRVFAYDSILNLNF